MNQEALLKILFFSIIALFAPNIFAANCGTRIGGLRNGHRYLLGDDIAAYRAQSVLTLIYAAHTD